MIALYLLISCCSMGSQWRKQRYFIREFQVFRDMGTDGIEWGQFEQKERSMLCTALSEDWEFPGSIRFTPHGTEAT